MRLCRWWSRAVGASLLLVVMGVKAALGVRSMVRGGQAHDVARGTNTLQELHRTWYKDSQEEQRAIMLDPHETWNAFISNSDRQRRINRQKKRRRGHKNQIPMPKEGPEGPPGRRGPQGPAGPPGGTLTTQEMEEYIKDFLRDFLQQNQTINASSLEEEDHTSYRSSKARVKVAFAAVLTSPANLKPSGLSIVDSFTIPFSSSAFARRIVMEHGGFTVIKRGIYQVAASLVMRPRGQSNSANLRPLKDISVYLCINTCMENSRRLEWTGSLGEGSVTAVLAGHVQLVRGNTLILAVDNPTKRPLQVGTGSSFSAALIGT